MPLKRLNIMNQLQKLMILVLLMQVIQLKETNCNAKTNKIEKNTDHDHSNKYITTQELNKLTSEIDYKITQYCNYLLVILQVK